jgi:hypothetical protein
MGLRSGEYAGHTMGVMPCSAKNPIAAREVCIRALSFMNNRERRQWGEETFAQCCNVTFAGVATS